MDASKDVASGVVATILGQAAHDGELSLKAGLLAQVAELLKCDAASASDGFLEELLDLKADLLSQAEKQKVIAKQKAKLEELEGVRELLRKQTVQSSVSLTKSEVLRLKKKTDELVHAYNQAHAASKAAQKRLDDIGFTADISDASFRKWEARVGALQQEVTDLEEQDALFDGLEPTNAAFKSRITELEIRVSSLFHDKDD